MIGKWKQLVAIMIVALTPRAADAAVEDLLDNAIDVVTSGFDYVWPEALDKDGLRFRLGVGVGTSPDYLGSDNYRMRILPLIDMRYKNAFVLQGTKLRINVMKKGTVKAGPLINYKFGRSANSNPALYGWGDVKDTVQLGAFVEVRRNHMLISGDVRAALGAGMGYEVNGLLAHGLYKNGDYSLYAGARAKWASKSYNQTIFGVTAEQAQISGLAEFHPGAGFATTDVNLVGRYKVYPNLFIEGLIGSMVILGGPAKSPLVADKGNNLQMIGGVGLRYAF